MEPPSLLRPRVDVEIFPRSVSLEIVSEDSHWTTNLSLTRGEITTICDNDQREPGIFDHTRLNQSYRLQRTKQV